MQLKAGRQAFRVALIYVIVAGGWILFSDKLVNRFASNLDEGTSFSIIKGLSFVLVTAFGADPPAGSVKIPFTVPLD